MKVTHLNPLPAPSFVRHPVDLYAEINTAIFDANGVSDGYLPPLSKLRFTPMARVCFHFIYMFELNVCLSPCLFPLLPPSLVVSWKVLPGILKKHCCILPDRNTGKGQTRCPLPSKQPHTHVHTNRRPHCPEKRENTVSGSDQWVAMLGNGCSAGGSHLSFSLRFFFSCTLRTSVSPERNCRLHAHSLLMSFT